MSRNKAIAAWICLIGGGIGVYILTGYMIQVLR